MADVDTALGPPRPGDDRRPRPRRVRRAARRRRPGHAWCAAPSSPTVPGWPAAVRRRRRRSSGRRRPAPIDVHGAPDPFALVELSPGHPARRLRRHLRPPGPAVLRPRDPAARVRRGSPALAGRGGRRARRGRAAPARRPRPSPPPRPDPVPRAERPSGSPDGLRPIDPARRSGGGCVRPSGGRRTAPGPRGRGGRWSGTGASASAATARSLSWSIVGLDLGQGAGADEQLLQAGDVVGRRGRACRPGRAARGRPARSARRRSPAAAWASPRAGRRRPACRRTASSPKTPRMSSRSWNASPSGSP